MKHHSIRRFFCSAAIILAALFTPFSAIAQDDWAADDSSFEARKMERYQQLVDQSPEKSYAFNQLMATVGKGAQYQKLLADYEKKVAAKPQNFNLRMILGHIYQHGGRTNEAIESYKKALEIKKTALAYMSIAAAEADNKNFEPAVQNYEEAAKLNPSKEQKQEIWRALAEIAIYRRDMERARTYFAELIKLEPNSLFIRRELSQIYAENRLYADARDVLEQASKIASASDRDQIEFDIAELYEQEGNDDEALSRYEKLSERLASSHWMQRELSSRIIDIHRRKGDVAGLAAVLEKKWKSPTYQQHLELADLFDETGNADKALAHIQKAISMSPKLPEAHEKLVRYYRSHGQIDKMFEAKAAQIKAVPDNPEYRFELYEAYVQQKKIDKAIAVLDEIQKKFTSDFEVQRRVAEFYQMNGRSQKALAIYENWTKKHPSDLEAIEALGDQYDASGEKKKALATWQKIENLNLDKATKLETLARIYDEHGYADEAEALYAKALAANKNDCQAHQQYADVLTRNGKQVQAIEAWQNLAKTCRNSAARTMASRQLASLYKARGMERNALQQYRGQCESAPDNLDNILMFASVAQALKMPDSAIPTLEAYVANHPSQTDALNALNALYAADGDLDSARKVLESLSLVSETEKREALISMAELDIQAGDLEQAQTHLSEALKLNANDADTHERLGDVLLKRRMYEEAANNYETAFQIDSCNFHVAFKTATCFSILGKTKEADALYVKIITNSTDETLSLKAARRAIDDHTWLGTLSDLSNELMPLMRSSQRKAMYLEILLSIADAQAQPHILTVMTQDAAKTLSSRHALRELGEKYATLIVESLLFDDVSISSRALTLSEWLASPNVVAVLGQIIEKAPTTDSGRLMQIQAVRAIAHAQSPAAVPTLQSCLESHNPRALREHAIWALGLIQSQTATDALKKALEINFDTFRALAVIGLGRQGAGLDKIHDLLKSDPSNVVRDAAAWMLAWNHYEKATEDVRGYYVQNHSKPHQIWGWSQIDESGAAESVLESLWCSNHRTMAAHIIRSEKNDAVLSVLSAAEAQGKFIRNSTSHYQSDFNLDLLLDHFSELSMRDTGSSSAWLKNHGDAFVSAARRIAVAPVKSDSTQDCPQQMLRDMVTPTGLAGIDMNNPDDAAILSKTAKELMPQLKAWHSNENTEKAGLSLQVMSLTRSSDTLDQAKQTATSNGNMGLRLDAIDAIASFDTPESKTLLRELSVNENSLIRAASLNHLDAGDPSDKQILEKALNDDYAIVRETAKSRLNGK
ncbi:MAG: tetratricopeptide repeat protein [Proteobacteria bacterium]|nr:tetratricopeptide repeat protein [Pseudomonadota bacterium]